jgi:integrase
MPQKTIFTEASVKRFKLPPPGAQIDRFEKLKRGLTLTLRISYGGTKAWRVGYYVNGRPKAKTIGRYPELGVQAARKAAFNFDPKAANAAAVAGSFKQVAEDWVKHYVVKKGLRSQDEIERILGKYVYPAWSQRPFFEIRRGDVNALLDRLEEKHGAPQTDGVLKILRSIMNWYADIRDENYSSPITKGMKRDQRDASERTRDRILDDSEIRAVWNAAEELGTFGALIRMLLLTAQRLGKVKTMRWDDISEGIWTIRTEKREKGNAGELGLPKLALDILAALPQIDHNPYVFTGSLKARRHNFNSFSVCKSELEGKLDDMPHWTLHDLRRTARSLMARAGVADNVAERVLGHAIPGIHGIYNRHDYLNEKADALARLATLVETILNPPDKTNVVELAARR